MRTHELAKILLENPDAEILMQKDDEGNGYRHMYGADYDVVVPDLKEYQPEEVYSISGGYEETYMDEEEWQETLKQAEACVIFY